MRTLWDKQSLSGSEPARTSLEQASLCPSGCALGVRAVGRWPGSLTGHRAPSLHHQLETLQAQPGLLCGWLLKAQEVSFRLGSRGWNPRAVKPSGPAGNPIREVGTEAALRVTQTLWMLQVGKEHPGLLQDPQPHLPPITPSRFTLGGEPLALFHDKPCRSITWWLSTRTKGRRPRSRS